MSQAYMDETGDMCRFDPIKKKFDMCLLEDSKDKKNLPAQLSIADDECHPPAALLVKHKEADTLIKAETAETGRVSVLDMNSMANRAFTTQWQSTT